MVIVMIVENIMIIHVKLIIVTSIIAIITTNTNDCQHDQKNPHRS